MTPVKEKTTIPTGYTFLNIKTFMSSRAKDILEGLLKEAANRNPDAFDMYLFEDFYGAGVFNLVDRTLVTLHSKVTKKNWDDAFVLLEGLTIFNNLDASWPLCDDGPRTTITNKAYGAILVTVLRALKNAGRLDKEHYPSLETLLQNAATWGSVMNDLGCPSSYALVCKAIGRRLFTCKPEEDIALEKARLLEWANGLKAETRDIVKRKLQEIDDEDKDDDDDGEDDEDEDAVPWYEGGEAGDEDAKEPDYDLSRIWREYKDYSANIPKKPQGYPSWDISKWSAEQKKEFEFAGESEFEDD